MLSALQSVSLLNHVQNLMKMSASAALDRQAPVVAVLVAPRKVREGGKGRGLS